VVLPACYRETGSTAADPGPVAVPVAAAAAAVQVLVVGAQCLLQLHCPPVVCGCAGLPVPPLLACEWDGKGGDWIKPLTLRLPYISFTPLLTPLTARAAYKGGRVRTNSSVLVAWMEELSVRVIIEEGSRKQCLKNEASEDEGPR